MCGICGYVHLDQSKQPSEAVLRAMMNTLVSRGPDDQGIYIHGNAALGHRRLSIIDLETGHQPMLSDDGSLAIAYNGEVYNFPELKEELRAKGRRFHTHSDTEVVLRAYEEYGSECVRRFNGMFAFAVWDSRKKELFLARDRFGKKPLYYGHFSNQFIFASEIKALLKHPCVARQIDIESVRKYLAYEYVPSPHSIFKNIYKLEPGFRMWVRSSGVKIEPYWDLRFGARKDFDEMDAQAELLRLLKESVRKRLVSDVPLGVFLSGGIDSSAVVAMMAELMSPKEIKTFSIGFKEKSFDESGDARRVAERFGTDHHEQLLDPQTMLDVFPKICDLLDEPFADSSIIPTYLVSAFTRKSVKVALGGDGGDEFFLGYPSFLAHKIDAYSAFLPNSVRKASLKFLLNCVRPSNEYMSLNFKARRFLRGLDHDENVRHQVWIGSFTPGEQRKLLNSGHAASKGSGIYDRTSGFFEEGKHLSPLDRAMYIYVKTYMTDDILAKVDRASMANSLEVRAPFLDTDFTEFAASIPASLKLRNFKTKWILKKALKGRLPEGTLRKPKKGFAVPVAQWLKSDLKGLVETVFERKKIEREGIFDYNHVNTLIREFMANRHDTRKEIWSLFMFEMWYDRWMR